METAKRETKKTFYIYYSDMIDELRVQYFMEICTEVIMQKKPDELYIMFSSTGGNVNSGIALYNFFKSLPVNIVMHNTGNIDSVAIVIFTAGNERYAASHSSFIFHGIAWDLGKMTGRINLNQLKELVSSGELDQEKISGIVRENTKIKKREMKKLFNQGESKDSAWAKEWGLVHEIREPQLPKGADFFTVNFSTKINK